MSKHDTGGEAPCLAELVDEDGRIVRSQSNQPSSGGLVVDLGADAVGSGGAIWSLPHGGDLDANLVRLDPDGAIGTHTNNEVDVLIFVRTGSGRVSVDTVTTELGPDHLALIPKGAQRSISAGPTGLTYLSVHRGRSPLGITTKPGSPTG